MLTDEQRDKVRSTSYLDIIKDIDNPGWKLLTTTGDCGQENMDRATALYFGIELSEMDEETLAFARHRMIQAWNRVMC